MRQAQPLRRWPPVRHVHRLEVRTLFRQYASVVASHAKVGPAMIRQLRLCVALLSIATACSPAETVPTTTTSVVDLSTSSTTATTLAPTTTVLVASTTTLATEPLGLITPTGVPVAIIEVAGNEFLVTTPCGNTATVSEGEPLSAVAVVIDPGHGGPIDTGAVGSTGTPEKEVNLEVGRLVQSFLSVRNISAVLTRTADYPTPLSVRANLADSLQASLMVSIHHNAPTPGPSDKPGVEVFVQESSDASKRLGGLLWEHARAGLDVFDVDWVAAADAGVMTVLNTRGDDAYGIIRTPDTPTALIELAYISSRPEAELFEDPNYVVVAARAVTDAIERYLTTDEPGSGFVEGRVFSPNPGVGRDVCVEPDLS